MKTQKIRRSTNFALALVMALALLISVVPMQQDAFAATTGVVTVDPVPGAIGIYPASGTIKITFDGTMNRTMGTIAVNGTVMPGTWDLGDIVYTVNYTGLTPGATYAVTAATPFQDVHGASPIPLSGMTSFTVDGTAPVVSSVSPTGTSAPSNGSIVVTFDEPMSSAAGVVTLNGVALMGGYWNSGRTAYTLPYTGLLAGTTYTVVASGFSDYSGNVMATSPNFTFTVISNAAPYVTGVLPTGGNVATSGNVSIGFDKAMDTSATPTVALNGVALGKGTWSSSNTVYTVPYSNLYYNTTYTVTLSGFRSAALQPMLTATPSTFTTMANPSGEGNSYNYTQTPSAANGYVARSDVAFSKFKGVSMNGHALVSGVDYVAREGSTIVTLTASLINRLGPGTHRLTMHFTDGTAVSNFNITTASIPWTGGTPNANNANNTQNQTSVIQTIDDVEVDDATVENVIAE